MNVKIPTAKEKPKQLPTAKTPVWFTRVSASSLLLAQTTNLVDWDSGL